ncbi:SGNH/GDSL hydrolase family protein [Mucilaginibacter mali]|uniref:SGNH/GDSL hydrolase family protein n=1 Tax=Mucilaginibacter mali TaxID=2740462 RepID=A0A7D4UL88_9SPHI|nr:SGNH/GDSL hydrolase family protein [Mucilaginibacter mali]QKJ31642.1 SGNH/GDSL hydrolase family protein [Mucilaginibacter mali]
MKTLTLFLLGIGSLFACSKTVSPVTADATVTTSTPSTMPATTPKAISYLALGDSYTIGQSVEQKDSFPYQLSTRLNIQSPSIIAQTGWTADNLIAAIDGSSVKSNTYDMVTLLIGVNDQYQGLSQTNYRTKFVQLLNTAIAFAKGNKAHVIVVSIPDYGVTPFANGAGATIGPLIDQFNAINKEETDKQGISYVNITPISKQAATDKSLIAVDGLHPSGSMYALWVNMIAPVAVKQLEL